MTFCIGMRVGRGLVALSDTRVVKGAAVSRKSKLALFDVGGFQAVLMTSGLRSVRDKAVSRVEDQLADRDDRYGRLHELASAYGGVLRTIRDEDAGSLAASGYAFNAHALLGGQFAEDEHPVLLHVYPEGNWVEATDDSPYIIIGRSSYGKPILDRLLRVGSTLEQAVSLAYLAFDATRASASDVDFPIDVATLHPGDRHFTSRRFTAEQLSPVHDEWNSRLRAAFEELPIDWAAPLFQSASEVPT